MDTLLVLAAEAPKPEDVTAGWTALTIFVLLIVAVALLGRSLVTQLRKADRADKEGVYGDSPASRRALAEADATPQGATAEK